MIVSVVVVASFALFRRPASSASSSFLVAFAAASSALARFLARTTRFDRDRFPDTDAPPIVSSFHASCCIASSRLDASTSARARLQRSSAHVDRGRGEATREAARASARARATSSVVEF
jgi:hypothetical protein